MNCDIYKAINHRGAYLFIEAGNEASEKVPEKVLKKLGHLQYVKSISFDEGSPLIAANPKEVIENIETNGFHIQGVEIKIDEVVSEAGAAIGGGILAASLGLGPVGAILGAAAGYWLANASKEGQKDES